MGRWEGGRGSQKGGRKEERGREGRGDGDIHSVTSCPC